MWIMWLFLYNVLLLLFWTIMLPRTLYRLCTREGHFQELKEGAGFVSQEICQKFHNKKVIWMHAVSVGEMVAATPIAKELIEGHNDRALFVTVVTRTGYEMAQKTLPMATAIIYFPMDLPLSIRRLFHNIKPSVILIVETEIWPNFISYGSSKKIPILMVNGRISDSSIKGYRKIKGFISTILKKFQYLCMQSNIDKEYILSIGAPSKKVVVTGNTKYDLEAPSITAQEVGALKKDFAIPEDRLIFLGASTHEGEDELILQAYKEVKKELPSLLLILAPRHPKRANDVATLVESYGYSYRFRSAIKKWPSSLDSENVLIVDTIGELMTFYSIGDLVFVGGSLVPTGGHNILEPALFGKPIIVGPHMFNFKEVYQLFQNRQGCYTVADAQELAKTLVALGTHDEERQELGARGEAIVHENQGATKCTVSYVEQFL